MLRQNAAVQSRDALQLAFALALAERGAEAGKGDRDQKRLSERPETGKPEDPRMTLRRRTSIESQNDRSGQRKSQSNDKSSRNSPGVAESGHNSIPWTGRCVPVERRGFGLSIGEGTGVPTAKSTANQRNNPTFVLLRGLSLIRCPNL
jgi:hypothetical protein